MSPWWIKISCWFFLPHHMSLLSMQKHPLWESWAGKKSQPTLWCFYFEIGAGKNSQSALWCFYFEIGAGKNSQSTLWCFYFGIGAGKNSQSALWCFYFGISGGKDRQSALWCFYCELISSVLKWHACSPSWSWVWDQNCECRISLLCSVHCMKCSTFFFFFSEILVHHDGGQLSKFCIKSFFFCHRWQIFGKQYHWKVFPVFLIV